jgi:hypothetical protein
MTLEAKPMPHNTIACFVSPHGYGHAARACAVMEAIHQQNPAYHFEIFTAVPRWFFDDSLTAPFTYHELLTDIGLVQTNSLQEDVPGTLAQLNKFLPFERGLLTQLADHLAPNCRLVLCDIAPMGIAVANQLDVPSLLVENFTWDWIYEGYPDFAEALQPHINYLRQLFNSATYHVQTHPICAPGLVQLTVPPVSRKIRTQADAVKHRLGIEVGQKMVMLTMGGNRWDYAALDQLGRFKDIVFVIAGSNAELSHGPANLIGLPANAGDFYHPDLINAADAVIGKVGYSTLAEVYQAGAPFGYVSRAQFRESPYLAGYIEANMPSLELLQAELTGSGWLDKVPQLVSLPKVERDPIDGADRIAQFVCSALG